VTKILATLTGIALCLAASVTTALVRGQAPAEPSRGTWPPRAAMIEGVESGEAPAEPERGWLSVVVPIGEVVVTAPLTARLATAPLTMGDVVVAGQVVAELDPEALLHEANEARARLHAREAEVRQAVAVQAAAQGEHRRAARLRELVPEAELAEAGHAAAAATAAVDRAVAEAQVQRVAIEKLDAALRDASIRAPIGGELTGRLVDPGTRVQAGDPIVHVVARERMVRFAVPLEQRPPVVGSALRVTCDAPGPASTPDSTVVELRATVAHVAPHIDGAARAVLVEARLHAAEGMRIGTSCRSRPADGT
jgi:multidrug efflux pump subunit AcrA (membrane-fusion protein)